MTVGTHGCLPPGPTRIHHLLTEEVTMDSSIWKIKLADCTNDQLMARLTSQGAKADDVRGTLRLQTEKNARAQLRRNTGMTNDQLGDWLETGKTFDEYSAAPAADDAGVAPEKEADMASKTKTTDLAQFMTGKGKGGTVTVHGGTTTGYQRGCRCDECKAAMSAYVGARREARKVEAAEAAEKKAVKAARDKARRASKKDAAVAA